MSRDRMEERLGVRYHYVWLIWSSAFLIPWLALFFRFRTCRTTMLVMSILTMPLGLSEPLFVPRYWNPPSLFDLAQRTGFDIGSLIFSFAIGGIGAVLYTAFTTRPLRPLPVAQRSAPRHRYHQIALIAPLVLFPLFLILPWNPIYAAIAALGIGGSAGVACRPDLVRCALVGGSLFTGFYALFLLFLETTAPGYIAQVWNLQHLSGIAPIGMPVEELLFGFAFGTYWSGLYEHVTWQGLPSRDWAATK